MNRLVHSTRLVALIAFVCLSLLAFALAQEDSSDPFFKQVMLTLTIEGDATLVFQSDRPIRYLADYNRYVVTIPDGVLSPDSNATFPASVTVTQSEAGLVLELNKPFRVTLSQDEHTLVVVRGEVLGTAPQHLGDDERSPVMYYLSNAQPAEVAGLLQGMYGNLQIQVDDRQRAILVLVAESDRELIDKLVQSLVAPRPQVMFEAEILEINQSITESLGIDYDSLFTFRLAEGASGDNGFGLTKLGPFSRAGGLELEFGINLLKANDAAEVLARPRVTTLDGVEATLNATQNFPILGSSEGAVKSVQSISTGITLRILPRVSPDGTIEAELSISVSSPTGITAQKVPTFSSRDASTTVRVANGQPIVIGGLLEKRTLQGQQKVPLLGDIPILGALFTSTSTEQRQTDLVIMVTPRIVDMPELAVLAVDDSGDITQETPTLPIDPAEAEDDTEAEVRGY